MENKTKRRIETLELLYGKQYRNWELKYTDDRELYCRMYLRIINAVRELEKVDCAYINIAVNKSIKDDLEVMREIKTRFN